MHWETPSQVGPRGSCGTSESHAKVGAQKAKYRESCTSQPINSSQTVAPTRWQAQGTKRRPQKPHGTEGRPRVLIERQHTNLSSAHKSQGAEGGLGR